MNLNILKGFLIILVVIDHNDFSRSLFPDFLLGFSFHVLGFLTIPFLKQPGQLRSREFGRAMFRLYYPFFLLTCALAIIVMGLSGGPSANSIKAALLALYSGNATILKQVTHMYLLWYLPSFISIITIRTAMENAGVAVKGAALASLLVVHFFVGTGAMAIQDYLPMGLLPALYAIPLAYLAVFLHRFLERAPALIALAIAATVYVAVKLVQIHMHLYNEIGFSVVADYRTPLALLVNDLEAVCGVLMLFQASRFDFGRFIAACGRYSLQVYLFHAFIAAGVFKALSFVAGGMAALPAFLLSLGLTVVLSVLFGHFLLRNRVLKRLIFPRDPAELFGRDGKPAGLDAPATANSVARDQA